MCQFTSDESRELSAPSAQPLIEMRTRMEKQGNTKNTLANRSLPRFSFVIEDVARDRQIRADLVIEPVLRPGEIYKSLSLKLFLKNVLDTLRYNDSTIQPQD